MLMTARMTNPAFAVAGAMDALNALSKTVSHARVPISHELLHLRASQINGCSVCVDMHAKALRRAGESEERVFAVSAWREAPFFSDAEREQRLGGGREGEGGVGHPCVHGRSHLSCGGFVRDKTDGGVRR